MLVVTADMLEVKADRGKYTINKVDRCTGPVTFGQLHSRLKAYS